MAMSKTTEPKSDQQNYDDYIAGPREVTIASVKVLTGAEQPLEVHLVEFPGRPYKPGKSMRRVFMAAWGPETDSWTGRRVTLYGDPEIRFGKDQVGGIRISHLSHIPAPLSISLTVTRGKRAPFVVHPLVTADTSGRDWLAELALAEDDRDAVGALGKAARDAHALPAILTVIRAKFQSLNAEVTQ